MKSIGEIMAELGFDSEAPISTQKAFIKHLINSSNRIEREKIQESIEAIRGTKTTQKTPVQLDFFADYQRLPDFDPKAKSKNKKIS